MVFGGESGLSQIIYFLLFFVFIFLYPRLMLSQLIHKIEKELVEFQQLAEDSLKATAKAMGKPVKDVMPRLKRAMEFVASGPIDVDPYGIVPKLDKTIKEMRSYFTRVVMQNSPTRDSARMKNLEAAVAHSTGTHEIAKIIRHFLEFVKKYKNFQIAMIINMQLPIIKDYARTLNKSVHVFINGDVSGDGAGPLVAAELAGNAKVMTLKDSEMAYSTTKINGRKCIIAKADGPGASVGYPGTAVTSLIKKYNPARIVTIDAMQKLEGEKTGTVAEGIGVAMNPQAGVVDRFYIDEMALKRNIPIDAVVIKMSMEEAFAWMPEDVAKAVPEAIERVKESIELTPKGKTVLILGVGNTGGVGNNKKELKGVYEKIRKNWVKAKKMKEAEKEKKWWQGKKQLQ